MTDNNINLRIEQGVAEVVEVPMPHPRGYGFVLVEQAYAGICTEQKAYATGYYEAHEDPLRMGHEGCGTIVEVGPGVTGLSEGDRVIVHIGWACGECWVCRNGLTSTNCENLRVASDMEEYNNTPPGSGGGAFNRYRLAPAINVQRIPDSLDFRYARAANCLIGSTYSIVRDFDVGPQTYALVAGVGFIGHAAIANLKHRGATVIALGRNVDRLAIAERLGVDFIVDPDEPDWLDQIRALTPDDRGVDIAYECSGHPDYQRKALDSLRRFGQLILMGYQRESDWTFNIDVHDDILVPAKRIAGMEDLMFRHRGELLELLQDPTMQAQLDIMYSGDARLQDAPETFEKILTRKHGKFYFSFDD